MNLKDLLDSLENEQFNKRKKSRQYDGLTDYVIPVVKHIRTGKEFADDTNIVAKKLKVGANTVWAACVRVRGLKDRDSFLELITNNKIKAYLKNRHPTMHEEIEKEL